MVEVQNLCALWGNVSHQPFLLPFCSPFHTFLTLLTLVLSWADGQRLGKNETGLAAPIEANMNAGRAGLGFGDSELPSYVPNPALSYLSLHLPRLINVLYNFDQWRRYAENGKRAIYARYEQTKPQQ
jgi:hypothetical protein